VAIHPWSVMKKSLNTTRSPVSDLVVYRMKFTRPVDRNERGKRSDNEQRDLEKPSNTGKHLNSTPST
jgi:hypothetical protein